MNKMIQEKDVYSVLILLVFKINNLIIIKIIQIQT